MNLISMIIRGTKEAGFKPIWDSLTYLVRKGGYLVRFGRNRSSSTMDSTEVRNPGPVQRYERQNQTVIITCTQGTYSLTVLAPDLFRVRAFPGTGHERTWGAQPFSYAVDRPDEEWPACELQVEETETNLSIKTARLVCRIEKATGRLTFLNREGQVINEDAAGAGFINTGAVVWQKQIQRDEHFYGLGERTVGLDLRERSFDLWNKDPHSYKLGQDPIHMCIPFLLGLHDGGRQGYGIFFDNSYRGRFDLGASDAEVASFRALNGDLRYYFFYGPALETVLERYTELVGRILLPPLWVLGYHQSRWSYKTEDRVRRLAHDFRRLYQVPCDAIHLDIHYMDEYRCYTWDPKRFPNPTRKIADLQADGFKTIVIIDPGIAADPQYWVCQSGLKEDVFCKFPDGSTLYKGPVWPGTCYFPDFTSPRVRSWWSELQKVLTDVGVAGIWNDMNEPAIFGPISSTIPDSVRHEMDGRVGDHSEAHNVYGMLMARATHEGLRQLRPEKRPVTITRAGWAGVQRYAMSWTGDNRSTWGHLKQTIPMILNLGLSGVAHTGPDIGGFSGVASGELFTRWLQMGIFLPFLRSHTFLHSPDSEPWSWGEPYLSINRRYIQLRYRLLPYLYTAFWQAAQTGRPVVRPLMLAFPEDANTHTLDDQFLCGDAFLIAPVVEPGATHRSVYLPAGTWYDFWTGETHQGPGQIEKAALLETMPIFVRGGSVIPLGPIMNYVGEMPVEELSLQIYPGAPVPGEASGGEETRPNLTESLLYQDDGESMAFEGGDYRLTRFLLRSYGSPLERLELERETNGAFRPACRSFEIIVHGPTQTPDNVFVDGETAEEINSARAEHPVTLQTGLFDKLRMQWDIENNPQH